MTNVMIMVIATRKAGALRPTLLSFGKALAVHLEAPRLGAVASLELLVLDLSRSHDLDLVILVLEKQIEQIGSNIP
jgi:hypothetical protein